MASVSQRHNRHADLAGVWKPCVFRPRRKYDSANLLAVQISVNTITALGLLNSGCYCIALSMGQLPSQIVQRQVLYLGKPQDRTGSPVRITVLHSMCLPLRE
ncbi:MAG: hypothetical protein HC862_27680 [Scytonema sp. RU_4_4]|nr:hypothetical protein [Scytonema sp. RU_4_4]